MSLTYLLTVQVAIYELKVRSLVTVEHSSIYNGVWRVKFTISPMVLEHSAKSRLLFSPLQLGKIGEKIYKVFKFLSNMP